MKNRSKVIRDLNKLLDDLPVELNEEEEKKKNEIKTLLEKIDNIQKSQNDGKDLER